jgi:hypothetical protein
MNRITSWGHRPIPLLPEVLRTRWQDELPGWVVAELDLPVGSSFSVFDATFWDAFPSPQVSPRIRSFLINTMKARLADISHLSLIQHPWPKSLAPRKVRWSPRTVNCLERAFLLDDPSGLSKLTSADLARIPAMGVTSILDFACVAEAVLTAGRSGRPDQAQPPGDLLALIEFDWAAQVSSEDPRFADVVPAGSGTLYERIDRITAEPQDPPLEESQLSAAVPAIRKRVDQLSSLTLEAALQDLIKTVSGLENKHLQALSRRLGADGNGAATLEEAARVIGVTRERMRQLQQRFEKRLPSHKIFLPQLDRALEIVHSAAPCSTQRIPLMLREAAVTRIAFEFNSLLGIAELFERPVALEVVPSIDRIRFQHLAQVEQSIRAAAQPQANASGASNVQQVVAELECRSIVAIEQQVREYLRASNQFEFLDTNWYWCPSAPSDRNRLRNLTRKMLSVASLIPVAELREGLQRHYRMRSSSRRRAWPLVVPPRAVLLTFYQAHPEFCVDSDGSVGSVVSLDYRKELNPTEQVIVDAIRSSPSLVMDRLNLARCCIEQNGMNGNTFSQYLYSSAVLSHLGTDLWSLRGIRVDPAGVEAVRRANAMRPRERRFLDHGWTSDGDLWIAARVNYEPARFVLGVPGPIRHFLGDRKYHAVDESGVPSGTIGTDANGTSFGYGTFLNRQGADENDLLLATFSLSEARVTLRLVDDDELEELSPTSN